MNERTTRGDFTHQAEYYGRARPSYPVALFELLLGEAGVEPGATVLELGAGTGLFTQLLSGRGFSITAVEPNESMRAQATELADAAFVAGSFEATGVADGSQDWAVAAQAFHWADPPRALPEIARTLAPKKCFTLLWNIRAPERSELLAWTLERLHTFAPGFDEGYKLVDWANVLTSTGHFEDVRTASEDHTVHMSRERYLDLWRSHNHLNATAAPEDVRRLLTEIEARFDELGSTEVDVPYTCRAWTARAR